MTKIEKKRSCFCASGGDGKDDAQNIQTLNYLITTVLQMTYKFNYVCGCRH